MSNTFGYMYIQGLQINLPAGQQSVGPYSIACSGNQDTTPVQCIAGSPVSYSVPSAVIYAGVLIVPPVGASGTLKMSFSAVTTSYFFIDPAGPTFINFDPANQPSVIYLNASVNENVMLQFI